MEPLLLLAVALSVGVGVAALSRLVKIPQVVGYLVAGVLIGPSVLGIFQVQTTEAFRPFIAAALGLVGFSIGGALRIATLRRLGKSILGIVWFESLGAFVLVGVSTGLLTGSVALGLVFGALASATAPAGTIQVIEEYRARGMLSKALYAVVGLDDAAALVIYGVALPIAQSLLVSGEHESMLQTLLEPIRNIGLSTLAGCVAGVFLTVASRRVRNSSNLLTVTLAVVFACTGIAQHYELSYILVCMIAGFIVANFALFAGRRTFRVLNDFAPPLYTVFFVLVGAQLRLDTLHAAGLVAVAYVVARSIGKWGGSYLGGYLTKAPSKITRYLGFGLLSQAGVAIGLAMNAYHMFEKVGMESQAHMIVNVIAATTLVMQLLGPIPLRYALFKTGEARLPGSRTGG